MSLNRVARAAAAMLLSGSFGAWAAHERLAAMEAFPVETLFPRWYPGPSEPLPMVKRQDGMTCAEGTHSCLDIKANICCKNTEYCFVNSSYQAKCCPLGSPCDSTQCTFPSYRCNYTSTTTVSATASTFVQEACCGRSCQTSKFFLCPQSLGGGCCGYDSRCASSAGQRQCIPYQTTKPEDVVSQVPEGCTTSQITCSVGGGCCGLDQSCTQVTTGSTTDVLCAQRTVVPTESGISAVPNGGGDLSTGAKAGIAVGVVVVSAVIIGVATWFCLRRRRQRRYSTVTQSMGEMSAGAGARGGDGSRRHASIPIIIGGDSDLGGATEFDRSAMGPITGSTPETRGGPTADYFGPEAVAGPYTDTGAGEAGPRGDSTTPRWYEQRGVPAEPHGPGDIVAPVEMGDSNNNAGLRSARSSVASPASTHVSQLDGKQLALPNQRVPENMDGRFELYGSNDVSPSPGRESEAPGYGLGITPEDEGGPASQHQQQHQQQQQQRGPGTK